MKTLTEKILECNIHINKFSWLFMSKKENKDKLLLIKKYEKYKNSKGFKGEVKKGIEEFEKLIDKIMEIKIYL